MQSTEKITRESCSWCHIKDPKEINERNIRLSYHDPIKYKETKNGSRIETFYYDDYTSPEEMFKTIDDYLLNFQLKNKDNYNKLPRRLKKHLATLQKDKKINIPFVQGDINLNIQRDTGNTIAIIGSSQSGKSYLMSYIYLKYFTLYISTLYTQHPNSFIENMKINLRKDEPTISTDELNIKAENLSPIISTMFFEKVVTSEKTLNQLCENKYKFLNMFDDQIRISSNKLFNDLILTYRNAHISTIICMQYSNLLSKQSRANYNYIVFLHLNTDEAIIVCIKSFLESPIKKLFGNISMNQMIEFYRSNTKKYKYILYNMLLNEISFGIL